MQAPWKNYRKKYKQVTGWGTPTNIEWYLRWYKVVDGQLPYCIDEKGRKRGYGAVKPGTSNKSAEATAVSTESVIIGTSVSNIIDLNTRNTVRSVPNAVFNIVIASRIFKNACMPLPITSSIGPTAASSKATDTITCLIGAGNFKKA